MPINRATDKKKALLAYKENLLNDIKYYEKRINEDLCANSSTVNFEDSSESEDDCPFTIDNGPMVNQLKSQQKMLQTGLHATQELSSLMVLQSKVDVIVEDPVIKGEPPVLQPGYWREVNADCRIDLVPFSTTFYIHQANGLFGAKSYRCLRVLPMKPAQERELSKSVLSRVMTPSDAVEILRSYSVAYRSRRTTLAKLVKNYANNLHMEPMPGGGYLMKCANLLEISWVLENKWSPVAPFYHKMIFNLENMDECYIKIIRNAHKQLGDPSTDTNQRTLLLAKIITTCLGAQGAQEVESTESDTVPGKKIDKRRLSLENEASGPKKMRNGDRNSKIDDGINKKVNIDDQIMAPPKSLPKKGKPKGKENTNQNRKSVKRSIVENETSAVKKARIDKNDANNRQSETEINVEEKDHQNKGKDNVKSKAKVSNSQNNTENPAKRSENEQVEANNERDDNISSKNSKSKEMVSKNLNNEEKPAKDIQKAKVIKSKSHQETTVPANRENAQEENTNDNVQKKSDKQIQEKPKKKVAKGAESQVARKDKLVINSKNDQKAKTSENKKILSDKVETSSKHDPKAKTSENKKATATGKIEASSKNDTKAKTAENKKTVSDKVEATSTNDPKPKSENKKATTTGKILATSKNYPKAKTAGDKKKADEKVEATSENDLKAAKTSEIKKTTATGKKEAFSKSEHKTKNSGSQNVLSKDKIVACSKSDLNKPSKDLVTSPKSDQTISVSNSKKGNNNARTVDIDDIPIVSANHYNIDEEPRKDIKNTKTVKTQKSIKTDANKKQPNKDKKKRNNLEKIAKPTNLNEKVINKVANTQKKSVVSKENRKSYTEPASANNAESKNDKHLQKNSTNKAELQNTQKTTKEENKSTDTQTNAQKFKTTKQKNTDRKKGNEEMVAKNLKNENKNIGNQGKTANKENSENNPEITENHKSKEVSTEKDAKDMAIIKNKKSNAQTSNGKPKMVIKNISHNNFASKKFVDKFNISAKNKKVKAVNIITKNKTDNDSGSKITKIPMKLSIHESLKKKNPLRISPRKLPSKFKSTSESMIRKSYFTNIPRLMKKPEPKIAK